MRIQLKPGLQLIRRGPATVQIGLDGRHGAVLDGLTGTDLELLDALVDGIDETSLHRAPAVGAVGPAPTRADLTGGHRSGTDRSGTDQALRLRRLVDALAGTGTLLRSRSGRAALAGLGDLRARLGPDAIAWSLTHPGAGDGWELLAARRRRTVRIAGSGRTGTVLAALLAAAGVGRVLVDDLSTTSAADLAPGGAVPADLGLPRRSAARSAVGRALGHLDDATTQDTPAGGAGADLVVLLDRAAADATRADPLLATDVAHLSVVIRETSVIVGPLVLPGRGPCLRCLDLHRSDRDRQWPLVLAQLLSRRHRRSAPREETALAQLAASLAALQVLGQLDGQSPPAAVAATLEAELPDGLISRRPWPAHAACGCHWPPAAAPHPDQEGQDGSPAVRMLS